MALRILTVCTGNICRSPLAEQLLRARLDPAVFHVRSAGVHALVDRSMDARSAAIAAGLGILDSADHRARQLTADAIAGADLVFALAREHRRSVVEMQPAASRRTFTVRELAGIIHEIDDEELAREVSGRRSAERAAIALVAMRRGTQGLVADPAALDVIDPYRRSDETYRRSTEELVPAIETIAAYFLRARSLRDAT